MVLGAVPTALQQEDGDSARNWTRSAAATYTPHDVITIDDDLDFAAHASSEGWPGDGSSTDPYIISGYEIDATGFRDAVLIGNTTVHFVVSACYLHNANYAGIELFSANHGLLENNNCSYNLWDGILLYRSANVTVNASSCYSNAKYDIELSSSSSSVVSNNSLTGSERGIYAHSSSLITICMNVCGDQSEYGICLKSTDNSSVAGNVCLGDYSGGIHISSSSNNSIVQNSCSFASSGSGIYLDGSSDDNEILNNICCDNANALSPGGFGINIGGSNNNVSGNICQGNLVAGIAVGSSLNRVGQNNCSHNDGGGVGISVTGWNNTITNNDCRYCFRGIDVRGTGHVVSYNLCSFSTSDGMYSYLSGSCTISGNNCSDNLGDGLYLLGCGATIVRDNVFANNLQYGVRTAGTQTVGNSLINNTLTSNAVWVEGHEFLRNNRMMNTGVFAWSHTHDIDTSNIVNGRPVYYIKYQIGGSVPSDAGQIILVNCSNMIVEGQVLDHTYVGIVLAHSPSNVIRNNTCSLNYKGIYLLRSDDNVIRGNTMIDNSGYGLDITMSVRNMVWNNTFIRNNGAGSVYDPEHSQALDSWQTNYWNSSGRGNYWSDWLAPDADFDGIVDLPYQICGPAYDHYPLTSEPTEIIPEFGTFAIPVLLALVALVVCLSLARRR